MRRKLEGNGPTRFPAYRTESILLVDRIKLDDDAIGLVRQAFPLFKPFVVIFFYLFEVITPPVVGIEFESPFFFFFYRLPMSLLPLSAFNPPKHIGDNF